jgi:hypothetical protein
VGSDRRLINAKLDKLFNFAEDLGLAEMIDSQLEIISAVPSMQFLDRWQTRILRPDRPDARQLWQPDHLVERKESAVRCRKYWPA